MNGQYDNNVPKVQCRSVNLHLLLVRDFVNTNKEAMGHAWTMKASGGQEENSNQITKLFNELEQSLDIAESQENIGKFSAKHKNEIGQKLKDIKNIWDSAVQEIAKQHPEQSSNLSQLSLGVQTIEGAINNSENNVSKSFKNTKAKSILNQMKKAESAAQLKEANPKQFEIKKLEKEIEKHKKYEKRVNAIAGVLILGGVGAFFGGLAFAPLFGIVIPAILIGLVLLRIANYNKQEASIKNEVMKNLNSKIEDTNYSVNDA